MNKHILLVDDDSSLRATLRTCLETVGYHCEEAVNGYDAREWLKRGHPVDLMVIDHQMPRLAGLDLIKILKKQVDTQIIPIIFYSGQLTLELKYQALQAGVNAVLEKPFPLQEFLDLVARIWQKTEK